jgi:hypothetical protein
LYSSIDIALPANVEKLVLTGTRGVSSSHVSGTETGPSGFARVEYAATLVAPRTFRR